MKNLTAILLLLALALTVTVDADEPKGSFNLSGSFDPGLSFGRGGHNRKHRSNVREEDGDDNTDDNTDWPSPAQIHSFDVPEEFTHGGSHGDPDEEHEEHSSHNHRNHGKRHSG